MGYSVKKEKVPIIEEMALSLLIYFNY